MTHAVDLVPITRLEEAEARIEQLVETLRAVEWVENGPFEFCPWCQIHWSKKDERPHVHKNYCQRQATLAAVEG